MFYCCSGESHGLRFSLVWLYITCYLRKEFICCTAWKQAANHLITIQCDTTGPLYAPCQNIDSKYRVKKALYSCFCWINAAAAVAD